MGLQTIINLADGLDINRRRVMGIQYTRSEVAKVNETVTRNPWKFTLTVPAMLEYNEIRDLLEDIDRLDRRTPEVISFSTATGASAGLGFVFKYRGDMTPSQVSGVTISSWSGNQLTLTNLPTMNSDAYMFKKGDFVQVQGYPYPATVQYDVLRGTGTTVVLTTHRAPFGALATVAVGRHILVGNDVEFSMF